MEGNAYQMERSQVEDYHHSRSRKSRIGAWASSQSREMDSKDDLRKRFEEFESKFEGDEIPLPPHWGDSESRSTGLSTGRGGRAGFTRE